MRGPHTGTTASPVELAPQAKPRVERDRIEHVFVDRERRQKLLGALVDLDAWTTERGAQLGTAGLLVGVVIDDEVVKLSGYGYRNVETETVVNGATVFRIGSITKTMTMLAILKLRDEGRLLLDARASRYLPELSGVQLPAEDARGITLRHLLMHTSGLPREGATADDTNGKGTSEAALLSSLNGMQLHFEPGSQYQYSNLGFSLLGVIIKRISGVSYRTYMARNFFEPLGLTSAAWAAEQVAPERLAWAHRRDADGRFVVEPTPEVFGAREPSGGLYLSGDDVGRYLAWQLAAHPARQTKPGASVSRSSRRESHAPGRLTAMSVQAAPEASPWVANAEATFVGLSWHGYKNCAFDQVLFHNGLVHTYASDAALLPDLGVAVFVLANSMPSDVGSLRRELVEHLRKTGALQLRERRATHAPRLERALGRLLEVYNHWDVTKYQNMLSDWHKQRITQEREQQELSEYRQLHGDCKAGVMLQYTSRNAARYLLDCDSARLEMALHLDSETGLIDGFVGHSSGVPPSASAQLAAEHIFQSLTAGDEPALALLLAPQLKAAQLASVSRQLAQVAPCELGELLERDGNRWHRFRVTCAKGPARVLALHVDDADPSRADGLLVEVARGGACAEK